MAEQTLKSGTCPKCGANEVYSDKDKARHNERGFMMVSSATGFTIDTYLCIKCGHFEEFFKPEDLNDAKTISKIKDKWTKI